jgi:serine/threonine protein kinase
VTAALCRTCGTLTYLSPEMSLKMAYSHAVDCWAVGIVLYVLLCGWARLLRLRQAVARSARWHSQRGPNALLRVPQKIVKPLPCKEPRARHCPCSRRLYRYPPFYHPKQADLLRMIVSSKVSPEGPLTLIRNQSAASSIRRAQRSLRLRRGRCPVAGAFPSRSGLGKSFLRGA